MKKISAVIYKVLPAVITGILVAGAVVFAWQEPLSAPPDSSALMPLNVSVNPQWKTGLFGVATDGIDSNYGLTIGSSSNTLGIKAGGPSYFQGLVTINNASTGPAISVSGTGAIVAGTGGITLGGANRTTWPSGGGGGEWTTSGNNIYNTNTGYVGIGTSSPTYPLTIAGTSNTSGILFGNTGHLYDDGSGNIFFANSGAFGIKIGCGTFCKIYGGDFLLDSAFGLDAFGALNIGKNNATTINIGTGGTNLTGITIGKSGINTVINGYVGVNSGVDTNYRITTSGGGIKAENNSATNPAGYFANAGGGPAITVGTGGITLGGVNRTSWPSGGTGGEWTTSGNNIYNTNTGNVGIGIANPTVPLYVYKSYVTTAGADNVDIGLRSWIEVSGSAAGNVYAYGMHSRVAVTSTGGSYREGYGILGEAVTGNDAVAQTAMAGFFKTLIYNGDSGYALRAEDDTSSTGAATEYGLYVRLRAAGITGTKYGVYINIDPAAGTGSKYGIYQETNNPNYFAGNISLGAGSKLILGSNASAPTGTNGAMYYDSTNNKFKCYQNGAWTDCIGSGGSITWPLLAPDGTALAPSYSFSNDTNIGIYRGGIDILKLVTAGSDRLTISANGNVGIGTIAPEQKLHVEQNLSVPTDLAYTDLNKLIISTTVAGSFEAGAQHNYVELNNTAPITSTGGRTITASFNEVNICSPVGGNIDSIKNVYSQAYISGCCDAIVDRWHGYDSVLGYGGTGTGSINYGYFYHAYGFGNPPIAKAYGLRLEDFGASVTERLYGIYIDPQTSNPATKYGIYVADTANNYFAGKIGIGDTNPAYKLTVSGDIKIADSGAYRFILGANAAAPTGVNGAMYYNSSENKFKCYQNSAWTDCIGTGGGSSLWTDPGTFIYANNNSTVVVADTGRIGIGTQSPAFLLDIPAIGDSLSTAGIHFGTYGRIWDTGGNVYFGWKQEGVGVRSLMCATGWCQFDTKVFFDSGLDSFSALTVGTSNATAVTIGKFGINTTINGLVLGSNASAPTGTNGAMYYDSTSNKFRCYQGGAWTDCIGTGGGSSLWTDPGTFIYANNNSTVVVADTGRIGIGTQSPSASLTLIGQGDSASSTGIKFGTYGRIYEDTSGNDYFGNTNGMKKLMCGSGWCQFFSDLKLENLDSFATLSLGTSNATSVIIGQSGILTNFPGGVTINTTVAKPACVAARRGNLWYTQSVAGTADRIEACEKNASNAYVWVAL